MHSAIILGCGRSGTSLVAGSLSRAGYFMGDGLWPARESNPKGFFEDREVNAINEAILAGTVPAPPRLPSARVTRLLRRTVFRGRRDTGQRWLARVALGATITAAPDTEARVQRLVTRRPFCFKDPRFCYTLDVWRPWLGDARFVCVFRDPRRSAASMVREQRIAPGLKGLHLDQRACLDVWYLMHRHVLDRHTQRGTWLFLHYDQVMAGDGLERLGTFLGATVDAGFPDAALRRSAGSGRLPEHIRATFEDLCARAGYEPDVDVEH